MVSSCNSTSTASGKHSGNGVTSIEYFDDWWDTDDFLVCLNRHFIFAADRNDEHPQWELLNADYVRWDAAHQRIYRNFRADKINKEDLPPHFPPPPEAIPPEALNPPPPPLPKPLWAEDYPELAEHLSRTEGQSVSVFLILYEDTYESSFGDGEFHYAEKLYLDRSDATAFLTSEHKEFTKYHLREGVIRLLDGVFDCQILMVLFDRFEFAEVLSMANDLCANGERSFDQGQRGG